MTTGEAQTLQADLVLEGGGVKGIGLVGAVDALESAGYAFHRVAGTSAGAIVSSLIAAGMSGARRRRTLAELDYTRFEDTDLMSRVPLVGKALNLVVEKGIYEGDYLRTWLHRELKDLGVETFADLRIPPVEGCIPPERAYSLVVIVSDVSRGRLVRLPWDYRAYGLDPDRQLVADAVRASMSIPFFFEPVQMRATDGRPSFLVDGGMLSNFPVDVLDRTDGVAPRMPTFGIKLSGRPGSRVPVREIDSTWDLALGMLHTMINAHDQLHVDDPAVLARTMFVDSGGVSSTDFHLTAEKAAMLYDHGRSSAETFLRGWDFDAYVRRFRSSGAPADVGATPAAAPQTASRR